MLTCEMDSPTQLPGEKNKMQQLPENRALCTGVPQQSGTLTLKEKLPGEHYLRRRRGRKRVRRNPWNHTYKQKRT